jgi:hypothetical protein
MTSTSATDRLITLLCTHEGKYAAGAGTVLSNIVKSIIAGRSMSRAGVKRLLRESTIPSRAYSLSNKLNSVVGKTFYEHGSKLRTLEELTPGDAAKLRKEYFTMLVGEKPSIESMGEAHKKLQEFDDVVNAWRADRARHFRLRTKEHLTLDDYDLRYASAVGALGLGTVGAGAGIGYGGYKLLKPEPTLLEKIRDKVGL